MLPQYVFYFFLFPWMTLIASMPGLVITFLFVGIGAQLLNYLPSQKDKTKST